jgi:hypothetical protein
MCIERGVICATKSLEIYLQASIKRSGFNMILPWLQFSSMISLRRPSSSASHLRLTWTLMGIFFSQLGVATTIQTMLTYTPLNFTTQKQLPPMITFKMPVGPRQLKMILAWRWKKESKICSRNIVKQTLDSKIILRPEILRLWLTSSPYRGIIRITDSTRYTLWWKKMTRYSLST